jgi:feruloyl esterase
MKGRFKGVWLALLLGAACASTQIDASTSNREAFTATPTRACADLAGMSLPDARVTATEEVQAGWSFPPSLFNMFSPRRTAQAPFCRVSLTIEREIKVEVWLPPTWNGRQLGVGNGGLSGALNYPAMMSGVAQGFAASSTDTGHETPDNFFDSTWVPGHPDRVVNFGHRAHHLMAQTARRVIAHYYGRAPHHSYFSGCSSGGWQGLSEAQRYPEDYDGVLAGAPANNFILLQTNSVIGQQYTLRHPDSVVPPPKGELVVRAAVAACDRLDGVVDGLIENPRACRFDPGALQCRDGNTTDCLTAPQVQRVRDTYGVRTSAGGMRLYPGPSWGAPPSFDLSGPGVTVGPDTMMVLALRQRPSWTTETFDGDRDIPPLQAELGPTLNSYDPNLAAFARRGGKLILYHGWADALITPENTLNYYEQVEATVGGDVRSFARLFMAPGMGHCSGGSGPFSFDGLKPLVDWVENGRAPDSIVAAHLDGAGKSDRTRPLCPWPKVARHGGAGSTDEAASFTCAAPN